MSAISAFLTLAIVCCLSHVTSGASCDPTPKACTRLYAPVCATFKKTFSNRCMMESELCKLAQDGFHLEGDEGDLTDCCSMPIPKIYFPTCASDGKTYDNIHLLEEAACKNRDYLTVKPSSDCPDFPHKTGTGWS